MKIQVNEFGGIMPKIATDKIPNNMAQTASSVKVASKEVRAYKASISDLQLAGASYETFFEYITGSTNNWVYYNDIVHWARSPMADDTHDRMYFTGVSGEYRAFANDIDSSPWDFTTDYYEPGAPAGTAPALVSTGGGAVYRVYFYTYVSRYGEEGPPSALSNEITDHVDGNVMQVGSIVTPTEDQNVNTVGTSRPYMNLYRTETDGAGTALFLYTLKAYWFNETDTYEIGDYVVYGNNLYLCDTQHTGAWGAGGDFTQQGEAIAAADLPGGTCPSIYWDRAPADLTNLRSHPNGFSVASKDKVLYFTEPFYPHAWPEDYQIPLDSEIIGVGIHGSTIVVATDANIFTFAGPHPISLYKTRLSFQPCLSQRGLVETDSGVMFPSKEGFQLVTSNGVKNITSDLFNPDDWDDYELETIHGTYYNKAYYGFYKSADFAGSIRIDFLNGNITTGSEYHYAGYVALQDGEFRTITYSDLTLTSTLFIARWDADTSSYRNYSYRSPKYITEKPGNMKVAQVILDTDFYNTVLGLVDADETLLDLNQAEWDLDSAGVGTTDWGAGDLGGPFNAAPIHNQDINGDTLFSITNLGLQNYVEFKLYADGVLKFTKQVVNSNMFKLPRGYKDKKWEFEIGGIIPVKRVTIATSTEEIV